MFIRFVIPYIDDAVYAFVLNELKDLAKNDYTVKAGNDSIFKKGTETPDSFTVDETAPSDVVITYSNDLYKENKTALETILNNLFWFYNPDKGEKMYSNSYNNRYDIRYSVFYIFV